MEKKENVSRETFLSQGDTIYIYFSIAIPNKEWYNNKTALEICLCKIKEREKDGKNYSSCEPEGRSR